MEWQLILLLLVGSLLFLMALGLPVALCFLLVGMVGVFILWGGEAGLRQLILSVFHSVSRFMLMPIPLFILMGEVMFHSGVAPQVIDTMDKWMGRVPGRLGLLAVGSGTLLSTLIGTSLATTAILGTVLVPEMERRGYKKPMSLGPILGSGGLALMIPPSGLAVLLGALGRISIGKILIAIIIPGLLMAVLYATYIILRCRLQPSIAPAYDVATSSLSEKLMSTVKYILPLGLIIFLVIGVIFLGIATPSEAAAMGAIGTFILAAVYRRLSWEVVKKSIAGTIEVAVMLLIIIAGADIFGSILAHSGVTRELVKLATGLPVAPILIFIGMQVIVLFLGTFMDVGTILMITLPLYMPIILGLGFNEVWFAVVMLLNIEIGTTSPPFGLNLFMMKSVAPAGTTMGDIYRAALPFIGCDLIAMALIMAFPALALFLPGLMG